MLSSGTSKYGIVPDIIPVDYKAESAVKALEEELKAGDSVLLIQPKVARDVIPRSLRHHDIDVDICVYMKRHKIHLNKKH